MTPCVVAVAAAAAAAVAVVVVAAAVSAICRVTNMAVPVDPGDFAPRAQPQTKPVSEQTGGVTSVEAARSSRAARGDSGYERSRRLTSKMKLLLSTLAGEGARQSHVLHTRWRWERGPWALRW
jgi:hypothetical protein